jgi:asparagine synthetase B (glutamine-hydrolysing)
MQAPQEPYTSFSGIWMLPPGHVLIANRAGVKVHAYHLWGEATADATDPTEAFAALEKSLHQRMDYKGVIGIPLSGGIDSGIIAFTADRLGIPYHLFSVVEAGGKPTPEAPFIFERLKRLRPTNVTLLSCNEPEYALALNEIFRPDYYSCEYFDPGAIPMHTVVRAMHQAGIRVALEGSGGDELFHGYAFRSDFAPIPEWPTPWRRVWGFYSFFTTLLAWTAKMDRAGAHFSIEARHPFQSVPLAQAAMQLRPATILKWPLRRYLLERLDYGPPTEADLSLKFGFTLEHLEKSKMVSDMQRAWCGANGLSSLPVQSPRPFPFKIGLPLLQAA